MRRPSSELLKLLRRQLPLWGSEQKVLVVPNFQRSGHGCRNDAEHTACRAALARGELAMPQNYSALKACLAGKDCAVFDSEYNPTGQSSTDIGRWHKLGEGETMRIKCIRSERYEPFVTLRRDVDTPTFDERFSGYGKNKVQQLVHLRVAGFRFEVLGRGFLLHFPHAKSASKDKWLHSSAHRNVDRLFQTFEQEVRTRYQNVTQQSPLCGGGNRDNRRGRQG